MAEGNKRGSEAVREKEETYFEMKDFNAKTESHFAKRVQTHEGCWYHN